MFNLPGEELPDPWDDVTASIRPPAAVTVKETADARGPVWFIRDAAGEPIDSTREHGRVAGLVEHWQKALYGGSGREPGDD